MARSSSKRAPATNPQVRENQLIELAVNLAERKLADGSATTPLITHYLKLATAKEQAEREKIQYEIELVKARAAQIQSDADREATYLAAIEAMRSYKPEQSNYDD